MILNEDFGQIFDVYIEEDDDGRKIPVFTYTPRKDEFEHYHIELSFDTASQLYEYLGKMLGKV